MSPVLCLFFCLLLLNVCIRIGDGAGVGGRDPRAAISSGEIRGAQGAAPLLPPSHTLQSPTLQGAAAALLTHLPPDCWHWHMAQAQIHQSK